MRESILVTIITVSYNSENTISDTIESVLNQSYSNIEYIIVDGGSKDKTINIVKSYIDKFKDKNISFNWISEHDKGIADAWNKGIAISKGDIIGILNSDDWYEKDAVNKAVKVLDTDNAEISYGICQRVDLDKNNLEKLDRKFNSSKLYLSFNFSHTTCFKTRKVYEKIGIFNLKYKIALDIDFLLRAYKHKIQFKPCDNVTFMRLGGISTKYLKQSIKEYKDALINNGFNKSLSYGAYLLKLLIYYRNKVLKNE